VNGSSPAAFTLKSAQFRRERERSWRELEELVLRVERQGLDSLSAGEVARLPSLYRSAVSSLSVATAISLDKNLLDYLRSLVGRAYLAVYGTKQPAWQAIRDFFRVRFPREVRHYLPFVLVAVLVTALATLAGYRLTAADPERFYSFVGDGMAQGRGPATSTAELRAILYKGPDGETSMLGAFATFLFTHNSKVGILSFALGFAAGVPVLFLLFQNGLALGAMAALYASRGLGSEFWAWVLPHGVTELTAVCLCGAAGLVVGHCLVFPGRHGRLDNLAREGRRAVLLAVGAIAMLVIAGALEGIFRQVVHEPSVRWLVADASLVFWIWYFLFAGRQGERSRRSESAESE
jgi:uncharacterized membrane protein SpoIIM required for sporulation